VRIFGLEITRAGREKAMRPVSGRGWWPVIRESFAGAWQQNVEIRFESVLSHHADFACRTLIASDIAKLRVKLVRRDDNGIWDEVTNPAYSPVLRKPNGFQNRIQFFEGWVLSKLQSGNTYVLKERDARGVVKALYVLDPARVTPLVTETGDVYYELHDDNLAGLTQRVVVPAREIIHDRFNCFFHPLVGLSPIFASGLSAMQGLAIQNDSTLFFQNGAQPGGILTAPGAISDSTAARLKEYWDTNFSGKNAGKVAVVGDGLKYEAMRAKSTDSQLIEQLKWTAEVVCGVYHVPAFMAGVGQEPNYNNVQNLTLRYYSQCLQILIEQIEACLDEGLGMDGTSIGVEFEREDLLQMDTATQYDVAQKAKGIATLDEQRRKLNLAPVDGGATIYLQQQDHSLAAIAARDALLIDEANAPPPPANEPDPAPDPNAERAALALYEKDLREALNA
jgi:HK97 family phage portal protein